jgi:sugar phosphate isomerase/epimerase
VSSERLGDELVLCNVSVAPFPLEDVFPAAAAAGFEGVSMLARPHARAVRHGRTNRELCELITDRGLFVCEIEAAGDWLGPVPFPADSMFHPVYTVDELLDVGEALEARTLVATHFGAPVALDDAARAFAQLCHRALERGCASRSSSRQWRRSQT